MKPVQIALAACVLAASVQANAPSTVKATIDIGSLLVSGSGFTFGDIPATFLDNAANATDLVNADSTSVTFADAVAAVSADTWATGKLIGTSLESEASAGTFSA